MADIYPLAADLLFGGAHLNPTIHVAASHMMYVAASHIWYVEYIYIYVYIYIYITFIRNRD